MNRKITRLARAASGGSRDSAESSTGNAAAPAGASSASNEASAKWPNPRALVRSSWRREGSVGWGIAQMTDGWTPIGVYQDKCIS